MEPIWIPFGLTAQGIRYHVMTVTETIDFEQIYITLKPEVDVNAIGGLRLTMQAVSWRSIGNQ